MTGIISLQLTVKTAHLLRHGCEAAQREYSFLSCRWKIYNINLLNPSGNYRLCSTCFNNHPAECNYELHMIRRLSVIISLNSINQLIIVMETFYLRNELNSSTSLHDDVRTNIWLATSAICPIARFNRWSQRLMLTTSDKNLFHTNFPKYIQQTEECSGTSFLCSVGTLSWHMTHRHAAKSHVCTWTSSYTTFIIKALIR